MTSYINSDHSVYPMDDGDGLMFSGKYRDTIFGDYLLENPDHKRFEYLDNVQEYRLNSSGYRGPDFIANVDLLIAGCSFTYGVGIPENGVWGSIIAKQNGYSYNNISMSGASIPWIVRQIFAYFKKYGNPKKLICLFPNPTKILFTSDSDILISDNGYVDNTTQDIDGKKSVYNTSLHDVLSPEKRSEYSKKPHDLKDIINLDFVIQICMQNIRSLEQYCRATRIEFVWGTWSSDFSHIIESQGLLELYDFSHYVKLDLNLWGRRDGPMSKDLFYKSKNAKDFCLNYHSGLDCSCYTECHDDLSIEYGEEFHIGSDIFENHPHFGVHRHVHIAQSFMKAIL